MKNSILGLIFSAYFLSLSIDLFSQNERIVNKLFEQDSTIINNRKMWIDFSFGPSLTLSPNGTDLFVFGPTLDFTYNRNYRLIKIKSSFHHGLAIFENNPQYSGELNFMSGKIKIVAKHTTEFYYGLGLVLGQKRVKVISSSNGGNGSGFSVNLPYTDYEKRDFIFVGIPFEYKIQWPIFGLGIDGNLNPYLPYLGAKWYIKIGNNYKK